MDLKFVVIENPYDSFQSAEAQKYFGLSIALRIRGFQSSYGNRVLPLDNTDYFGTHVLLCTEKDGVPYARSTYKTVSLKRCREFNQPFPILEMAKNSGQQEQVEFVEERIAEADSAGMDLNYLAVWTLDRSLREADPILAAYVKEILIASIVNYHHEPVMRKVMVAGNGRHKTDKLFFDWGFEYGDHHGKPLATFSNRILQDVPCMMMKLNDFSDFAKKAATKHRQLWDNRMEIGENAQVIPFKKAA